MGGASQAIDASVAADTSHRKEPRVIWLPEAVALKPEPRTAMDQPPSLAPLVSRVAVTELMNGVLP